MAICKIFIEHLMWPYDVLGPWVLAVYEFQLVRNLRHIGEREMDDKHINK